MAGLRDKILNNDDSSSTTLEVPEWDHAKVEIRSMSVRERSKIMEAVDVTKGTLDFTKFYPDIIIACVFDPETGEKVFTPADADSILDRNVGVIERLCKEAMVLSGVEDGAEAAAGKG